MVKAGPRGSDGASTKPPPYAELRPNCDGISINGASVLQPSTTRHDAQPSVQEPSLRNDADYECSGQESRRSPVRPISNDPDPKRDIGWEAAAPSQPCPAEEQPSQ
jgi:hypothetical protein